MVNMEISDMRSIILANCSTIYRVPPEALNLSVAQEPHVSNYSGKYYYVAVMDLRTFTILAYSTLQFGIPEAHKDLMTLTLKIMGIMVAQNKHMKPYTYLRGAMGGAWYKDPSTARAVPTDADAPPPSYAEAGSSRG